MTTEKCAELCDKIGRDWFESGTYQKAYAAEYLAAQIRDLPQDSAPNERLRMALEFLLERCEEFDVYGTRFRDFRDNRDALDTARAALADAK